MVIVEKRYKIKMKWNIYFLCMSTISLIHYDSSCHAFSSFSSSSIVTTITYTNHHQRNDNSHYIFLTNDDNASFRMKKNPSWRRRPRTTCLLEKKNKIAGPRASSRRSPSSSGDRDNKNNKNSPWDTAKDSFYFAYDTLEQQRRNKKKNNQVGAGYQDDEREDIIRERLSIQEDEAKLTTENPKKQGFFNNLFSNYQKNSKDDDKTFNPLVETVEQVSRNENGMFQTPNMMDATSPTDINQRAPRTNNKSKKNDIIRQIDMSPTPLSVSDKASDPWKEIPQTIQSNVESIQNNWNEMEDAVTKIKVFLKMEQPKLEPHPPEAPKKKKKEVAALTSTDVAKFSVEAAGGFTRGLVQNIGSSTGWAVQKAWDKQQKKAQLKKKKTKEMKKAMESFSTTLNWTDKVERYDTAGKSTEELLAELDPELSLEVTEALKLAEEALNSVSSTNTEETTSSSSTSITSDVSEEDIAVEKVVEEQITFENQDELLAPVIGEKDKIIAEKAAPIVITTEDTTDIQVQEIKKEEKATSVELAGESREEIETVEEEQLETVLTTTSKPITTIKDNKIEITLRDVDDALRRARQAAEEAKRDVEELEKMLMALD